MNAPKAKKIEHPISIHNDTRIDNYYWLNDRTNPEVTDYLKQENLYTEESLNTNSFQKALFKEMKIRIKEDDSSTPYKFNGYWYMSKYEKGSEYSIHSRKKETLEAKEEIFLDENKLAKEHSFFHLTDIGISLNNKFCFYSTDTKGRRIYTLYIKDLNTGELLSDKLEDTCGNAIWTNDNKTIFYVTQDKKTLRPTKVFKHILGSKQSEDILIYEEKDETFDLYLSKTKSNEYLNIVCNNTVSTEYYILNANTPEAEWEIFQKRKRGLEYSVDHFEGDFYILTNKDKAYNFKIMKCPLDKTSKDNWSEFIEHQKDTLIEDFEIYTKYLAIESRKNALTQLQIISWDKKINYFLPFGEEVYTMYTTSNYDVDSNILRYVYTSLTTPWLTIDFNMDTQEKIIMKEEEVLGDFNKDNYITKRLWAEARDGEKIPLSLVMKKDTIPSDETPLLLYAYGSYGASTDPAFSSNRLSLLDRGFIYVITHVRGGEEMGREWYEDGKMLHKLNTFYDFIDSAKYLIKNNYTSPKHLYANGGSAGGMLMGCISNMAPELFNGIVSDVPFVDVVTTMLDDTIPLTTGEYDEWGNPNDKEYYEYMKSYSPYDNVETKDYPNMLVTTGLHDSQVQYWEPAKWVAKLREYKTDDNLLLLQTNMDAGHGGASGRFEALKEIALEYAFYCKLENKII